MADELTSQIAEAKHLVERCGALRRTLAPAQERAHEARGQLRRLEYCVEDVQQRIASLESFTLESLIQSLLGRKQRKLSEGRQQLAGLEEECTSLDEVFSKLQAEVEAIEVELAELGDPQQRYRSLCDRKQEEILRRDGEEAEGFRALMAEFDAAKEERRAFRRVRELGRHLLGRLDSMTSSLGRTQNKRLHGVPLGVVGNLAVKSLRRHTTTTVSTSRVRDGLDDFAEAVQELSLNPDNPLDARILDCSTIMAGLRAELAHNASCGMSVTLLVMEKVQEVLSLVEERSEHVEDRVESLEQRRCEVLERA